MKLCLFRHAQTPLNERRAYLGRTDEALSPSGVRQAEALAQTLSLRPQLVITSGMRRTVQTAAILFPQAAQLAVPAFAETDFGDFEGKTYQELSDDPRYQAWVDSGCRAPCPQGESQAQFVRRVAAAFLALPKENSLTLVVHGGTIMALLAAFAKPPVPYFSLSLQNGEWLEAELSDQQGQLTITDWQIHRKELS